ncbi:MAG: 16S rRNA (cytosine(1402)-N(4))-methyltransferase RsmH [Burkholderiales bacterium]|nr:16S rRNA (cytosine(1402)-N(4))-methyltransferase RsmH [Burkholderiales bacterium]
MLHHPVLLNESIELLKVMPDGTYIDGTFGRGGHTQAILKCLNQNGRIIAFDKDMDAINYGRSQIIDPRLNLIHDSFANFEQYLSIYAIDKIDGILLDLGVSSVQLDNAQRGFSFRLNGDLDMRMDNTRGISAIEWINSVDEVELANVLWKYGEEKFSRVIAKNIVTRRNIAKITTTVQLAEIISQSMRISKNKQHPATRCFQAIRIYINNELDDLERFLAKVPAWLKVKSRVVIISFHSLEDRIVKDKFNQLSHKEHLPKWINKEMDEPKYKVIAKKVRASLGEIEENTRSRSAILRGIEKIMD